MLPEYSYSCVFSEFSFLQNRYVSFNFYEKWLNFQNSFEKLSILSSTLSVNSCCKPSYVIRQWFSNRLYIKSHPENSSKI